MSLPYHIGNGWFGGFLPPVAFAVVAATGNIYDGLWYPIIIAVMTLVIGVLFVRETKDNDINALHVPSRAGLLRLPDLQAPGFYQGFFSCRDKRDARIQATFRALQLDFLHGTSSKARLIRGFLSRALCERPVA